MNISHADGSSFRHLPDGLLKFVWVVNIQPVGSGEAVLMYRAPYVHWMAITNHRIVSVTDDEVVYQVLPSGKQCFQRRKLSGERFVRAPAQQILPLGFQEVRYYGFMSPNDKLPLENVRWLIQLWIGHTHWLASGRFQPQPPQPKPPRCDHCGSELKLTGMAHSDHRMHWSNSLTQRGQPCD